MSSKPPHRPAPWPRRLAALALGSIGSLLLLELGLQTASLFASGGRAREGGGDLICQGDSNTYGLHLPVEHAYPAQLERLLATRPGALGSVANLGVPAKPSWVVARQLEEDLLRFRPRAAVIWCGVNDFSQRRPGREGERFSDRLRTVGLLRRLLSTLDHASRRESGDSRRLALVRGSVHRLDAERDLLEFEDRLAGIRPMLQLAGSPDPDEVEEELGRELVRIATRLQRAGCAPLLLTYPLDQGLRFEASNRAARRAARESGARCVDTVPAFEEALLLLPREELLFKDLHPTRLGYSIVARRLLQELAEEGLVQLEADFDVLAEVRAFERPELALEPWREDGRLVGVCARYEPGHRVQLVLARGTGALRLRWGGALLPAAGAGDAIELPLADDDLAAACLQRPGRYLASFDGEGRACLRLHPELEAEASETGELWAAALLVHPGQVIGRVAGPLRLR